MHKFNNQKKKNFACKDIKRKRGCKNNNIGINDIVNDQSDFAELFARKFRANQSTDDNTKSTFIDTYKQACHRERNLI